jgi:ABC-type transporter Mla maintaining outer membrane lipid asymmetry permease subunit MlaE
MYSFSDLSLLVTPMATVNVSEVAAALASIKFDIRKLNDELDAFDVMQYDRLELRLIVGLFSTKAVIEMVLNSWAQKYGNGATIGFLGGTLACYFDDDVHG